MADYQLTGNETVFRSADNAYIPNDPANRDRQDYDKWLADGGVPDPYVEPPPPIPATVSNRQFYYQLTLDGRMSQNDAREAMAGMIPGSVGDYVKTVPVTEQFDAEMRLLAIGLPRDDQYVVGLLGYLGVTDIDAFYIVAAVL